MRIYIDYFQTHLLEHVDPYCLMAVNMEYSNYFSDTTNMFFEHVKIWSFFLPNIFRETNPMNYYPWRTNPNDEGVKTPSDLVIFRPKTDASAPYLDAQVSLGMLCCNVGF